MNIGEEDPREFIFEPLEPVQLPAPVIEPEPERELEPQP